MTTSKIGRGAVAVAVASWMLAGTARAQAEVQPTNDLPNPYVSAPWGRLPEGRQWGALSAVAIDNDGESVWIADRCGSNPDAPPGAPAFQFDSCSGSKLAPVMKFDASGNFQRSFGAGLDRRAVYHRLAP